MAKQKRTRAERSPAAEPLAHAPTTASLFPFFTSGILWAIIAFQPISADDLWWHLSRGREVLIGSWAPSAALLSEETNSESDWLSGLIPFLLFIWSGSAGLMVARLLGTAALVRILGNRVAGLKTLPASALIVMGLLAASPALDPLPPLVDLVGLVTIWGVVQCDRRSWLILLITCLIWCNFSPHFGWAIPVVGCRLLVLKGAGDPGWKKLAGIGLAVLAVCCLSPRGPWGISDSFRLLIPTMSVSQTWLNDTSWAPLYTQTSRLILPLFTVSMVAGLASVLGRRTSPGHLLAVGVAIVLGWSSSVNAPFATLWLILVTAELWQPIAMNAQRPDQREARERPADLGVVVGCGLLMFCLLWLEGQTWGWGIAARLDPRFLELALPDSAGDEFTQDSPTAFCLDVRGAGQLAWTNRKIKPQDVPQRALLGDRLRELQLLEEDLRQQRMTSYRRSDETVGGWWIPLMKRSTVLVLVPADRTELIRSLASSVWQPLSLDAPVLPFGSSGEPAFTRGLVTTLQLREMVNLGQWEYQPPISTFQRHGVGSPYERDRWRLRSDLFRVSQALEQARVFRALELRYAALRVLAYTARRSSPNETEQEFTACQRELEDEEELQAGQPSQFRHFAAQGETAPASPLEEALHHYRAGQLQQALAALPAADGQATYAAACLLLEAGDPESSLEMLNRLASLETSDQLQLLGRIMKMELEERNMLPVGP